MREKNAKQPRPAPTASTIGPCPTIIQISRTPRHWKFTQHLRTTWPPPPIKWSLWMTMKWLSEFGFNILPTHRSYGDLGIKSDLKTREGGDWTGYSWIALSFALPPLLVTMKGCVKWNPVYTLILERFPPTAGFKLSKCVCASTKSDQPVFVHKRQWVTLKAQTLKPMPVFHDGCSMAKQR